MSNLPDRLESMLHRPSWLRWLLLFLIFLSFARLTWQLDGKTLWWDESLSLQRAESAWLPLLRGDMLITDDTNQSMTRDQHPFTFFLLLGALVRLAGQDEYVLRFVSVISGTLLVPMLFACARWFERRSVVPASTSLWAALLATINPFYLWYGQEARPYITWVLFALMSVYWSLRWTDAFAGRSTRRRHLLVGYLLTLGLYVTTHFYAVLHLPVHGMILVGALRRRSLRAALIAGSTVLAGIGIWVGGIAWLLWSQAVPPGGNLQHISFSTLARDLLNAHSLGLSVRIDRVWLLDLMFGGLGLIGLVWGLRHAGFRSLVSWILPAFVLVPVVLLFGVNLVQPVYMNSRHLALISGGYLLLVAAGLGAMARLSSTLR